MTYEETLQICKGCKDYKADLNRPTTFYCAKLNIYTSGGWIHNYVTELQSNNFEKVCTRINKFKLLISIGKL